MPRLKLEGRRSKGEGEQFLYTKLTLQCCRTAAYSPMLCGSTSGISCHALFLPGFAFVQWNAQPRHGVLRVRSVSMLFNGYGIIRTFEGMSACSTLTAWARSLAVFVGVRLTVCKFAQPVLLCPGQSGLSCICYTRKWVLGLWQSAELQAHLRPSILVAREHSPQ